jgi:uncharacterized protein YcgI (DUF1989 family)
MSDRKLIEKFLLEPATGRGVPVLRGQVIRIEQIGKGHPLDFNAYNLHDYKEYFHAGRTRMMHGLNPTQGDHLWSSPPRDRRMFTILEDTVGTNDIIFPRCTAFRYEYQFGFSGYPPHSNCADIFAETVREWELTPDDVHDSFNGFTNSGVNPDGTFYFGQAYAREGDYIDLLAHFDTLAVPVSCGGDLSTTNNYEIKGLKIQILEGNEEDRAQLATEEFDHQRTVDQFKVKTIKADRPLKRDPSFVPEWPWLEAVKKKIEVEVELDDRQARLLEELKRAPEFADFTEAEIVRYCFFRWWTEKFMRGVYHLQS